MQSAVRKKAGGESVQELCGYDKARYYFEHEVLPDWFYEDGTEGRMIRELQKDEAFFLWDSMLCLHMPNPQRELLCFQVYLVFSKDYRRRRYFTVERGTSSEVRFLCSWEPDGGHSDYGQCILDTAEIEKRIDEIFTKCEK